MAEVAIEPGPEGRRAQIIRVALEVLAERGYAGTSLGAIARRVGISQPGLLHHFGSKDQLLLEALTEWEQANVRWLQTQLQDHHSLFDRITKLVELHVRQPQLVRSFMLLSAGSLATHHPTQDYFRERYRALRQRFAESLVTQLDPGLPANVTPRQAATLLIAMLDGVQLQWLLDPDDVDFAATANAFLSLLGSFRAS